MGDKSKIQRSDEPMDHRYSRQMAYRFGRHMGPKIFSSDFFWSLRFRQFVNDEQTKYVQELSQPHQDSHASIRYTRIDVSESHILTKDDFVDPPVRQQEAPLHQRRRN